jgi:hypothetical protein
MTKELIHIYNKKKQAISDAETKTRIALAQSRKETELATVLFFKLKKMDEILATAEQHAKSFDMLEGRPLSRKHYANKVTESLTGMRTLHTEAKDLVNTLFSIKKAGHHNIKAIHNDLKKIDIFRKKIENITKI